MPEGGVGTAAGFIVNVEGGVVPHLHLIQDFLSAHTHSSMVNVVVVLHVTIVMKKFGPILMGYILCTEGIPDTGYPAKKNGRISGQFSIRCNPIFDTLSRKKLPYLTKPQIKFEPHEFRLSSESFSRD